jgi:pentatricopeptide repeat protein
LWRITHYERIGFALRGISKDGKYEDSDRVLRAMSEYDFYVDSAIPGVSKDDD